MKKRKRNTPTLEKTSKAVGIVHPAAFRGFFYYLKALIFKRHTWNFPVFHQSALHHALRAKRKAAKRRIGQSTLDKEGCPEGAGGKIYAYSKMSFSTGNAEKRQSSHPSLRDTPSGEG